MKVFAFGVVFLALETLRPSYGAERPKARSAWSGVYLETSRNYQMTVEQFSPNWLSVNIQKLGAESANPSDTSTFIATISGDVAKFKELRDPQNCQADLRRVSKGIFLEDHCGSADGGLYLEKK